MLSLRGYKFLEVIWCEGSNGKFRKEVEDSGGNWVVVKKKILFWVKSLRDRFCGSKEVGGLKVSL